MSLTQFRIMMKVMTRTIIGMKTSDAGFIGVILIPSGHEVPMKKSLPKKKWNWCEKTTHVGLA